MHPPPPADASEQNNLCTSLVTYSVHNGKYKQNCRWKKKQNRNLEMYQNLEYEYK